MAGARRNTSSKGRYVYKDVAFEVHLRDAGYIPYLQAWALGFGTIASVTGPFTKKQCEKALKKTVRLAKSLIDVSPWMSKDQMAYVTMLLEGGHREGVQFAKGATDRQLVLLDKATHERWDLQLRDYPPVPPFTKNEARVALNELRRADSADEARQWYRHYSRNRENWEAEQRSWMKEFGKADENYAVAARKASWLAGAWAQRLDELR